jgi:hypothetical protein
MSRELHDFSKMIDAYFDVVCTAEQTNVWDVVLAWFI